MAQVFSKEDTRSVRVHKGPKNNFPRDFYDRNKSKNQTKKIHKAREAKTRIYPQGLFNIDEDVISALKEIAAKVKSFDGNINHNVIFPQLPKLADVFNTARRKYGIDSDIFFYCIATGVCAIAVHERSKTWALVFGGLMAFRYFFFECDEEEIPFEEEEFRDCEAGDFDVKTSIVASVLSSVSYICFKKSVNRNDMSKFISDFGNMPKFANALSEAFEWGVVFLQKFLDACCGAVGVDAPDIYEKPVGPVYDYCEEAISLCSDFAGNRPICYSECQKLLNFWQRGIRLQNGLSYSDKKGREMMTKTMYHVTKLKEKLGQCWLSDNGLRHEPFVFVFIGPPGTGKTISMNTFLVEWLAANLDGQDRDRFEKNMSSCIYNVSEDQYWSGYTNQTCVLVDDANQLAEAPGMQGSPGMKLIRMINMNAYNLNMAALEDKGHTSFNSKIVCVTSNSKTMDFKAINHNTAVLRRLKNTYVCVPKLKYCIDPTVNDIWNRRLDFSKISDPVFDRDVPEYFLYDWDVEGHGKNPHTVGMPKSYDELINDLDIKYEQHENRGDHLKTTLNEAMQRGLARMKNRIHPQGGIDELVSEIAEHFGILKADCASMLDDLKIYTFKDVVEKREQLFSYPYSKLRSWKTALSDAYECFKDGLVGLLRNEKVRAFLACIPVVLGMWKMVMVFSDRYVQFSDTRREDVDRVDKMNMLPKRSHGYNRFISPDNFSQCGSCSNPMQTLAHSVVRNNVYSLYYDSSDKDSIAGSVLFLTGRVAVMPLHFWCGIKYQWKEGLYDKVGFTLKKECGSKWSFSVKPKDVKTYWFEGEDNRYEDIIFLEFPKVVPSHKNIIKNFIDDINGLDSVFHIMLATPRSGDLILRCCSGAKVNDNCDTVPLNGDNLTMVTSKTITYGIATRNGDCGSLCLMKDGRNDNRILGFHIAGTATGRGYSYLLTKEIIKRGMSGLKPDSGIVQADFPGFTLEPCPTERGLSLYKVDKPVNRARHTKIEQSPLHGFKPTTKIPARLGSYKVDGELVEPMKIAQSKQSPIGPLLNLEMIEVIGDEYAFEMDHAMCLGIDKRVLSFREAVEGIPTDKFINGIPRDTSAGYPLSLEPGANGKRKWFGSSGPYDFSKTGQIEELCDRILEDAKKGIRRGDNLYVDSPKDEILPRHKVRDGKVRMISACSVQYAICLRMYTLSAVSHICFNRIDNGIAVGLNPYSNDWDMLHKRLNKFPKVIAGDFSKFDCSIPIPFLYKACQIIETFYDGCPKEDTLIREVLFEDIVNARHLDIDLVYEVYGGMPSGNPLTTIVNSIANQLMIRYCMTDCYLKSVGKSSLVSDINDWMEFVGNLSNECYIITYGDDNVMSISSELSKVVDQVKMTQSFACIGMVYTNEKKDGEVFTHRQLSEVEFLKRSFVFDKRFQRFLAPLSIDSIMQGVQWKKKSATLEQFYQSMDMAILEMSLHSKPIFDDFLFAAKAFLGTKGFGFKTKWVNHFRTRSAVLFGTSGMFTPSFETDFLNQL